MAEPIGAILGHGTKKANPYEHLKGIGAGTTGLAHAVPQSTPDVPRLEDGRLNSAFVHC